MKKRTLPLIVLAAAFPALTQAAILIVNPSDIMFASSSTTTTDAGTVLRGNSNQVEIRNRGISQIPTDNRTVATFANFDISSILAGGTINSATLTATYESQLNDVNAGGPASVGAVATAWDTSGTSNPLLTYGWDHTTETTAALNTQVWVADIENTAATGQAVSGIFTSTVQGWLDTTLANNGLVFFMDGDGAQGAGFDNVVLTIDYTPVPEPSSAALFIGAAAGLFMLRRRR